jgi:hypothetical protein
MGQSAETPPTSRWGSHPATWIVLAAVYALAGKLGLALAFVNPSASAVWPPTGIALAAILILGPRAWPGIFLGAFFVNETTTGSLSTSLAIAAGNTLEALVGAYLVNRFAGGRSAPRRGKDRAVRPACGRREHDDQRDRRCDQSGAGGICAVA